MGGGQGAQMVSPTVLRAPPMGGWSGVTLISLPRAPECRRQRFVTESAGRPFKTHDDAEALFVGCQGVEGQSTNRDKESEGQSSSAFSNSWWMIASHQAALRPRGRGASARLSESAVSSQHPPAWLETWAVSVPFVFTNNQAWEPGRA